MLKTIAVVISIFMITIPSALGQKLLTWEQLGDVKFTKTFSAELGIEILEATFGTSVKALDNTQVIMRGFMIPLDPLGTKYVLSKNPMASCFFCGAAGPETVVELRLHPKSIRRYAMDEIHSFKGTFRINEKNDDSLHYILEMAERQ